MNFVHVPRTGGWSIATALDLNPRKRCRASETPRKRFAFVRNPLDRLVSTYEFLRQSQLESHKLALQGAVSFSDWVAKGFDETQPEKNWWIFMRTQRYWLDADMDFIGRFETLAEDFALISSLPLIRSNQSTHGPWQGYYDAQTLAIAVTRFSEDFDRYDYDVPGI